MIKFSAKFLLAIFISLSLVTYAFAQDSFDQELAKARRLVEEKYYDQALGVYAGISADLGRDPGLIIEWARVYTYADNHPEAIKLFEEIRTRYPERFSQILRELGDQYRWSGQRSKAISVYREGLALQLEDAQIYSGLAEALFADGQKEQSLQVYNDALKRWPDRLDLLLDKANALSLEDKLEDAYLLYQSVLDKDPENLNALNSQARILVWQGYHRQGLSRYEEILKRYPNNPDALEGMAFAFHWLGDDPSAVARIKELLELDPKRKEALELYSQIKGSQYPFIKSSGRFSDDSTPQTLASGGLRAGVHLNYSASIDAIYEHQVLDKKGAAVPRLSADRQGLGLSSRFDNTYEFNAFLYQTQFNKIDFNPFTSNTWFTYKPDDYWRFDLAYERETFEDNDALFYKIVTNSPSLSADFRPNRFWLFNLKYKRSYFSDDNRQNQIFSKIEYRLWQKPFVKLYYNYYYSGWGEPELSHGYFNPRSLRAHTLGLYTGLELTKKLFVEAKASGGYEFQRKPDNLHKKSDHPTAYVAASLNYRLADNWLLSASGDFFTTWPDHGQRSYQKRGAYLSLTYNFVASPVGLRETGRPYRSTGSN